MSLERYFREDLRWGWDHQARAVFQFLCRAADAAAGDVILDAGAGHQRYKPFFSRSLYIAQEHPDSGATAKQIDEYDILADVKIIPLVDESVGAVLSTVSLEHMRYPEPFFQEAFRVLKPGCSLFVQAPFVYEEHETPYDFQRPTSFGLRRWYEDFGFQGIEVVPTSSSIYTAQWLLETGLQEELERGFASRRERMIAASTMRIAKWTMPRVVRLFDRGPFAGCRFPIGWTAIGRKPGERLSVSLPASSTDFLARSVDARGHFNGKAVHLVAS
jgi:SAM-dependent methyltransferase